ncbi:MAG: tetratricopeptide repeat protein [Bacteroidia bacterium]
MHRLKFLVVFILFSGNLLAQDSSVVSNSEEITADLFQKKEWKKLIEFSESAIKQQTDFFYIRFRLGVAYYSLKQYRIALFHFEKAFSMNSDNESLREYLYYCYLFTEQYPLALKLSDSFSDETKKNTKTENPPVISFVHTEYGLKFSSDQSLYQPMNYFQLGFGFRFGREITAYNAYSYVNQQVYDGKLSQQQYYLTLNIPVRNSWTLMPAIHFIDLNFTNSADGKTVNFTPVHLSFAADKVTKDFKLGIGASFSNLKPGTQLQQQVEAAWYPLHNNSFSVNAGTILFTDTIYRLWPMPFAGVKYFFTPKFSASFNYLYAGIGNGYGVVNFSEMNGYLVSNSPDATHQKMSLMFDWNIYKNLGVYAVLLYESKTEVTKKTDYDYRMALAGLKFIF